MNPALAHALALFFAGGGVVISEPLKKVTCKKEWLLVEKNNFGDRIISLELFG